MNHSKLILVAFISAFVAITTAMLGVTGTIIGSVMSSVLYNFLSEVLEKPVQNAKLKTSLEWDVAYIFPLAVISLIQLLLVLAFLSEWGLVPGGFLKLYMLIQGIADNNLYRVLGFSLLVMSVYPFILKPDFVKKSHGLLVAFIGLIFLARGFADLGTHITDAYGLIFYYFDFPIALIALLLLLFVIYKILLSAHSNEPAKRKVKQVNHRRINNSSKNIQFESNDLLDEYKK